MISKIYLILFSSFFSRVVVEDFIFKRQNVFCFTFDQNKTFSTTTSIKNEILRVRLISEIVTPCVPILTQLFLHLLNTYKNLFFIDLALNV